MLTLNASSLRATLNETGSPLAGPPMATPTPAGPRDPAGFASLLRQSQAGPAPHAIVPPPEPMPSPQAQAQAQVQAAPEPAPKPEPANDNAAASPRANAAPQGKPRDGVDTAAARRGTKPANEAMGPGRGSVTEHDKNDTATNATTAGATNPPTTPPALDPTVLHWLAGQQRGNATAADTATATGIAPGDPTRATEAGAADAPGATPGGRRADLKADAALSAKAAQGKLQLGAATSEGGFGAVLAEQHQAGKPAKSAADATAGFKDIAAAAAALTPSAAAQRSATAPLAVAIATPVAAPQFAQSLGLQMSVLARDGVQHAELHLNPADMGPVSVQIVIDGTQARVDFGADVAATRHAIEAGLPELASAMRDAGFTLAGGGVSQHSRGRGDGSGGDASAGPGTRRAVDTDAAERIDSAGRASRRTVRIGGLDLYA